MYPSCQLSEQTLISSIKSAMQLSYHNIPNLVRIPKKERITICSLKTNQFFSLSRILKKRITICSVKTNQFFSRSPELKFSLVANAFRYAILSRAYCPDSWNASEHFPLTRTRLMFSTSLPQSQMTGF